MKVNLKLVQEDYINAVRSVVPLCRIDITDNDISVFKVDGTELDATTQTNIKNALKQLKPDVSL